MTVTYTQKYEREREKAYIRHLEICFEWTAFATEVFAFQEPEEGEKSKKKY